MHSSGVKSVLLAGRHPGLTEGLRGLLESLFDTVVMVADEASLLDTASRLQPTVAVADLSLVRGGNLAWVRRLRDRCPEAGLILLTVHEEPTVRTAALDAGADALVLKKSLATDLLPTLEAVLERRTSPKHHPQEHLRP